VNILCKPKEKFEPNNIFDHQEFRGLLNADYQEAIQNSNLKSLKSEEMMLSYSS